MIRLLTVLFFHSILGHAATIAIIDTGFDLDHEYLRPKIMKKGSDEVPLKFQGTDLFDNSHLKTPVIDDNSSLQEILLYRNLRAKRHREGLTFEEFEWFKKKSADQEFMEKVRLFKKHSHGTIVAGIALREGENIKIFPIRGLNIPTPVVAVDDGSVEGQAPLKGKTPEERFQEDIKNSLNRVSKKFSKICHYVSQKKIEVVNASYGINHKNISTKFRERYKEFTGKEIEEVKLNDYVNGYFKELYNRGLKTMRRYPKILFVFSAGNAGLDNDLTHHYPSKIKIPNAITVAAMNGDYLATFSNFGRMSVDIGAPGVAIISILPKVYAQNGGDIYSPASGTSMAAPYVSNLAAQIWNTNKRLTPEEVKRIILETGDEKPHLMGRLSSGSIVNNQKAIKSALLSLDMNLDEAINLGKSNLIPIEDQVSFGNPKASPDELKKKVMEAFPSVITPAEVDEEPNELEPTTKPSSSSQKDQEKVLPGNSSPLPSKEGDARVKSSDPVPSNQMKEQSPLPSEERPASSSLPAPQHPVVQSPESAPSLPQ